jgi:glycosyltransferase involved in cell wall biosynthesis
VTVDFLRFFAERGQPVPLCTLTDRHDGAPAEGLSGTSVARYDLGARRLLDLRALRRLVSLVRGGGFDVIHAHGQDAAIMGFAARRLSTFRLVVTRHVLDEPAENLRQRVRAHLALDALRRADAPVAVSQAAADRLATLSSIPPERIRVIRNGVRLDRFDPVRLQHGRATLRKSMGIGPEVLLVLLPAVLRPGKGHDILLAAAPLVLKRFPQTRFALAGSGEMEVVLRSSAAALGSSVLFLGHRSDVPELLAASDLVVLPSLAEALPTVAMEAAAAGRTMVGSRVGGVPEVVEDGITGALVPPGDARALADAVVALLANADTRSAMGRAARQRALENFGMEAQARRTLRLWREVAGNGKEPA